MLSKDWWRQCLELCINLLETLANYSTEMRYKLSTSSRHKLITELLIILSEVFEVDSDKLTPSLSKQLASSLVIVVQKRSFPLQVCKIIGTYMHNTVAFY